MAGFQAVGLPSSFSSSQSIRHRFHAHHRQPQETCPSGPGAIEGGRCLTSSDGSGVFGPSSKSLSFSSVTIPPAGSGFRNPETDSGSSERRHSDDSSVYLRSEWVTLSKAMLMVLVEKICQLSFENEPALPPGTSRDLRDSSSSSGISRSKDDDAEMIRRRHHHHQHHHHHHRLNNLHHCDDRKETPKSSDTSPSLLTRQDSSIGLTAVAVPPAVPSQAQTPASFSASSPSILASLSTEAFREQRTTSQASSEASINGPVVDASILKSRTSDEPQNIFTDDTTRQETTASEKDGDNQLFSGWSHTVDQGDNSSRRRCSKRDHRKSLIGGGVGKSGESVVKRDGRKRGAVVDDGVRKLKVRSSLRQRNTDRNVQSWFAYNKTLVYRMIDKALGTSTPDAQQVPVAGKFRPSDGPRSGVRQGVPPKAGSAVAESAGDNTTTAGNDAARRTGATDGCLEVRCEKVHLTPQQSVVHPKIACEAPLLGALLSCDDAIASKSDPSPVQVELDGRRRLSTSVVLGTSWHGTYSSGDPPLPIPSQNPPRISGQGQTPIVNRHQVPAIVDEADFGGGRFAGFRPTGSLEMVSRGSNEDGGQASPRSEGDAESVSVQPKGRSTDRKPRARRRFGSEGGTQPRDLSNPVGIDLTTSGHSGPETGRPETGRPETGRPETGRPETGRPETGRPLWIALDKSDVCSLVDSLVSTMMTDDDVTGRTSGRCHSSSASSSSNTVSNSNNNNNYDDRVLDTVMDSSVTVCHHKTVAYEHSGNQGNDTAVDFRRADTANAHHHGNAVVAALGDHGNGKERCRRKHDIQCLLFESSDQSEDGSSSRTAESESGMDNGNFRASGRRGSRYNLKWKSNMMLRLHSQSQDGETA